MCGRRQTESHQLPAAGAGTAARAAGDLRQRCGTSVEGMLLRSGEHLLSPRFHLRPCSLGYKAGQGATAPPPQAHLFVTLQC